MSLIIHNILIMDKKKLHLGLDVGSISVNTVLVDERRNIIENHYHYCHGKPFSVLKEVLDKLLSRYGNERFGHVAITDRKSTRLNSSHYS